MGPSINDNDDDDDEDEEEEERGRWQEMRINTKIIKNKQYFTKLWFNNVRINMKKQDLRSFNIELCALSIHNVNFIK